MHFSISTTKAICNIKHKFVLSMNLHAQLSVNVLCKYSPKTFSIIIYVTCAYHVDRTSSVSDRLEECDLSIGWVAIEILRSIPLSDHRIVNNVVGLLEVYKKTQKVLSVSSIT